MEEKQFTEVLDELINNTAEAFETPDVVVDKFETVTDDNVNDFILAYGSKLVKDGMESVGKIKNKITSAQNPDQISAMSEMIRALNSTLDTLTKISLQNKKEKVMKEAKQLDFEQKKLLPNAPKTQIIVSTREDIFKQIAESEKLAKEIEVVEESEDSEE